MRSRNWAILAIAAVGTACMDEAGTSKSLATDVAVATPELHSISADPNAGDRVLFTDNFDGYQNLTKLGAAYARDGQLSLVTGRGGSGRAVRFSYSGSNTYNLIEKTIAAANDVYVRYWYRTSVGADPSNGGANAGGTDMIRALRADGSRWAVTAGQSNLEFVSSENTSTMPAPFAQNVTKASRFGTTNDGKWHELVGHFVGGSAGYVQVWVDGILVTNTKGLGYAYGSAGVTMLRVPGWMAAAPRTAYTIDVDDYSAWVPGSASSAPTPPAQSPVSRLAVTPSTVSLSAGQQTTLSASTYDIAGATLTGRTVTWSSSDENVATVSASGVVTAVAAGSATITAMSEGQSSSSSVSVSPVSVASVSVSLAASSLTTGQTTQATASARDASGNVLTGRAVTWSSSNPAVATVSASGVVTAVAAGSANIVATSEGQSGSASIGITAPAPVPVATVSVSLAASSLTTGQTTQASATARDASGNVLTGRAVTWSSSNTAVATVSASGVVTAVAAGSASIVATSEGRTGSATASVSAPAPAPVATVTLSASSASLTAGQTQQLSATTRDASGNVLTGRTISWSSSNNAVASVSASGVVTAVAAGSATVTATSEGRSASASITVTASSQTPPPTGSGEPTAATAIQMLKNDGMNYANLTELKAGGYLYQGSIQFVPGRTGNALRFPYSPASMSNEIEYWIGGTSNPQPQTDIKISYWFRTSPGADPTCRGANSSGFKWFMLWRPDGHARYTQGVGNLNATGNSTSNAGLEFTSHDNSSTRQPNPFIQNVTKSTRFGTTNDGQWHRYTLRVVTGSAGYEQIWVDGVKLVDNQGMGYDHDATGIQMLQWPGTMVSMPSGCDFYVDVEDLTVWR